MLTPYEKFSGAIFCIYQDMQKLMRREMAQYGLKSPHGQCLIALEHFEEGITASQLCQIYDRDKAAVSRTIVELEEMGLVRRRLPGGSRYRAKLTLTERGREIAQTISQTAELAVRQAGADLTEIQRQVICDALWVVAGSLHGICQEGLQERA